MWSFFADLIRNAGLTHTVVVMDAEEVGTARRYQIRPRRVIAAWGGSLFVVGIVVAVLFVFTPLRRVIPGYGTEQIEESARLNAMRVQVLQDSLSAQRHYIERLRQLITGRVDSATQSSWRLSGGSPTPGGETPRPPAPDEAVPTPGRTEHEQPALTPSKGSMSERALLADGSVASGPTFPVEPPVENGFPTRSFNARTGHYGLDVAVSEGAYVRAIGDGYVVLADWTQDGGHTIAVQHANGYLSIYKHNRSLLKQLGDRVRAQDPLAVSGNTGEITTGPHLHFELWRNGLAQDPQSYVARW